MTTNSENKYKELFQVGQVFKNYKALCEHLGEDIKGGNAKKSQLKNWVRYFSYDTKGYSLIISEIYEVPKALEDGRSEGGNTISYLDKIEKLILDLLVQEKNSGELFISRSKLLERLNIVNQNYSFGKYNPSLISTHSEISKEEIKDFYETTDGVLKRNIERALNSLENKSLIMWDRDYTVAIVNTDIELNSHKRVSAKKKYTINQYGDTVVEFEASQAQVEFEHRRATKAEKRNILRAQKEVMKEYGYQYDYECYNHGKSKEFYDKINNILFKQYNIHMYYYSYEIIFNDDHIQEEWERLEKYALEEGERVIEMIELNNEIADRIFTNAERRHLDALKKFIETNKNKYKIRLSEDYLENSAKLIGLLILYGTKELITTDK